MLKCDFAATRASILKRHVESKHEGVRYPCPQCEFAATTASNLKRLNLKLKNGTAKRRMGLEFGPSYQKMENSQV